MSSTCLLLLLLLFSTIFCQQASLVKTSTGYVRGFSYQNYRTFFGIPYAEPAQRWTDPQAKQPWSNVYDATQFGAACPQTFHPMVQKISEDCLFVNVWTPSVKENETYPVVVYIHGGGFLNGNSDRPVYSGEAFAAKARTIFVSMNYRLGALGFLVSKELQGNYGIMDQRLALEWVHNNIVYFGGDPQRVTLMGQSAGAISVAAHMAMSHLPEMHFQRVIMMSNPFYLQFRTATESAAFAEFFGIFLGCAVSNVTCMREKTLEQLMEAQGDTLFIAIPPNKENYLPWIPTIDDKLILGQPIDMLRNNKIIPGIEQVIMGTTMNETASFSYQALKTPISPDLYEAMIIALFGIDAAKILRIYPKPSTPVDARVQLDILASDFYFICPTRDAARILSNHASVYIYQFIAFPDECDPMNPNVAICTDFASCHSADIKYAFQSAAFSKCPFANEYEQDLSDTMLNFFANVIHGKEISPQWPKYEVINEASITFNSTVQPIDITYHYNDAACDMWDEVGYR